MLDNSSLLEGLEAENGELRSIKYNLDGDKKLPLIDRISLGKENLSLKLVIAKKGGGQTIVRDLAFKWQDSQVEGNPIKTFKAVQDGRLENGTNLTKADNGLYMACFVLASNDNTKPFEYKSSLVTLEKDATKMSVENSKGAQQESAKITIPYATKWYPLHIGHNGRDNLPVLRLVEDPTVANPVGIKRIDLHPLGVLLRLQMDNQKDRQWYYHRGYKVVSDYYSESAELDLGSPIEVTEESGAKVYHHPNFKAITSELEHNDLWLDEAEELGSKQTWSGMTTFSGNANRGRYSENPNFGKGTKNNLSKFHFLWLAPVSKRVGATALPDTEDYQKLKLIAFGGKFGRWNRPYTITFKRNGQPATPKNGDSFYERLVLKERDSHKIYRKALAIDYLSARNENESQDREVTYQTSSYANRPDRYVPFYEDWVSVFPESIPGYVAGLTGERYSSFPVYRKPYPKFFLSKKTPETKWFDNNFYKLPQVRWFYSKNVHFINSFKLYYKQQVGRKYWGGLGAGNINLWHPQIVSHNGESYSNSEESGWLPGATPNASSYSKIAHLYNFEKVALYTTKNGQVEKRICKEANAYYTYDFNFNEIGSAQPVDDYNDKLNTVFYGIRYLDVKTEDKPNVVNNDYRSIWRYEVDPNNYTMTAQAVLFGDEPSRGGEVNDYASLYAVYFNSSGGNAGEMGITKPEYVNTLPDAWNILWNCVKKHNGDIYRNLFSEAKKFGELAERTLPTKANAFSAKISAYLTQKRTAEYPSNSVSSNRHYNFYLGAYYADQPVWPNGLRYVYDPGEPQNIGTIYFAEFKNNDQYGKAAVRCFRNIPFMIEDK